MRIINTYRCHKCGYQGRVAESITASPISLATKVCNKDKRFVVVITGFLWLENKKRRTKNGAPYSGQLTCSEAARIKNEINKCPLHHDSDISEVRRDENYNVLCPKCESIMTIE